MPHDDRDNTHLLSQVYTLSQVEKDMAKRFGIPLVDLIAHKQLEASGAFREGYEKPFKYIVLK